MKKYAFVFFILLILAPAIFYERPHQTQNISTDRTQTIVVPANGSIHPLVTPDCPPLDSANNLPSWDSTPNTECALQNDINKLAPLVKQWNGAQQ